MAVIDEHRDDASRFSYLFYHYNKHKDFVEKHKDLEDYCSTETTQDTIGGFVMGGRVIVRYINIVAIVVAVMLLLCLLHDVFVGIVCGRTESMFFVQTEKKVNV